MLTSINDLIAAVLTGLLGSLLTLAVERTLRWFRARAIERKFPVSGKYLTRYTDKGQSYKEIVEFRQTGRKIRGESILSCEDRLTDRRWLYEAEVRDEGYIHGSYKPETPFDKGFGAFFCKFGKHGDMQGYWLGKDADESDIQWGDYEFRKQPAFTISAVEKSDVIRVLQIAEQQLGDAYIDESHLETNNESIALCVRVQETAVGFVTARIVPASQFLAMVQESLVEDTATLRPLQRRIVGETNIGLVASSAVSPKFTGRGLGGEVIGRCIEELEQRGANVIVATAWMNRDGVRAGSILECRGFHKLLDIQNYWEKDSVKKGYSCPNCGAPPCHCTAVLYIRNRHSDKDRHRKS